MRITQSFLNNMVRINSDRASAAVVKTSAKLSALSAVEQPSDDPVVAQRLVDGGVEGVITDVPDVMAEALQEG